MKAPTLYLDTSAIGGYFDDEWKDATRELWRQMMAGQWVFVTSAVAVDELALAPEQVRELFGGKFRYESAAGDHAGNSGTRPGLRHPRGGQ